MIRKTIIVICLGLIAATTLSANNKEQKRLENSGVVMQEIMNIPDNIPHDVMEKAEDDGSGRWQRRIPDRRTSH
jgi:hypothetical protein